MSSFVTLHCLLQSNFSLSSINSYLLSTELGFQRNTRRSKFTVMLMNLKLQGLAHMSFVKFARVKYFNWNQLRLSLLLWVPLYHIQPVQGCLTVLQRVWDSAEEKASWRYIWFGFIFKWFTFTSVYNSSVIAIHHGAGNASNPARTHYANSARTMTGSHEARHHNKI